MADRNALAALIEAVEAGVATRAAIEEMGFAALPKMVDGVNCGSAYNGSLDAAKALHEALLPGWEWGRTEGNIYVKDPRRGSRATKWGGPNDNHARAWLLAVLRALAAGRPYRK